MPFKPGKSGNPAGRPKGSRNKFADKFMGDFLKDWEANGAAAIAAVRDSDPSTYLRVAASILPKEAEITLRNAIARDLSDDELANIAAGSSEGTAEAPVDPSQLN